MRKPKQPDWREPAVYSDRVRRKIRLLSERYNKADLQTPLNVRRARSYIATCKRMGFRVYDGGLNEHRP